MLPSWKRMSIKNIQKDTDMSRQFSYIPHTEDDIRTMLKAIGVSSIDELFSDIPSSVTLQRPLDIPEGISEHEAAKFMKGLAERNILGTSFLGCGIYDHIVPPAVNQVLSTPAFVTAYTPYQAEISQGLLQGIFEFQSLVCKLTGMDVSNASLYDGATAAAEAAAISLQARRKADTILVSEAVHPFTRSVLRSYYQDSGVKVETIPVKNGATTLEGMKEKLDENTACVILQTPNIFGILEDFSGFADAVHEKKALAVISSNPMSLGVCRNQGSWGADIAIGDTQPFGLPASFGGPTVGYIGASGKLLRKMPGRIVGETQDTEGKRAFVLTLQAREQHIKRERATSNICSNQALAALASTAYLAMAGPYGLKEAGEQCAAKARYLYHLLQDIPGINVFSDKPFFNEFTLDFTSGKKAEAFIQGMNRQGIFAGVHLGALDDAFDGLTAVAVTEKRTREEMDRYAACAREVLS